MAQEEKDSGDIQEEWQKRATRVLKGEMLRFGITPELLSGLLEDGVGLKLDGRALSQKINRGRFSFAFFLQCMHVMGVSSLDLYLAGPPDYRPYVPKAKGRKMKLIDDDTPAYQRKGGESDPEA